MLLLYITVQSDYNGKQRGYWGDLKTKTRAVTPSENYVKILRPSLGSGGFGWFFHSISIHGISGKGKVVYLQSKWTTFPRGSGSTLSSPCIRH